jgi:phosphatidylinositol kinase/protein kinase (PI-3  family)
MQKIVLYDSDKFKKLMLFSCVSVENVIEKLLLNSKYEHFDPNEYHPEILFYSKQTQ